MPGKCWRGARPTADFVLSRSEVLGTRARGIRTDPRAGHQARAGPPRSPLPGVILELAMPVQIGEKTHSFSEPTGLLSDCHRRIEMFMGSLEQVAALVEKPLDADARISTETALRYFREAAPKHTADEEDSLFPRLRQMHHPDVDAAIQTLAPLEAEHRRADSLHSEVDRLGRQCLDRRGLSPDEAQRFRQAVAELASIYKEHIRIEDELVFPIAGKILSSTDKAAIAAEMAARRK